ncbi:MAG: thioesterase family protein [Spirochaetaceae bacterium]|nr:thioesterase family protein [Myxococcales bacterium]MCB9726439.1 thioesterase family protein [Spirochaetaceae bacterium]HPG25282.1 thioesterase family protein [Myxococcota bacterium]
MSPPEAGSTIDSLCRRLVIEPLDRDLFLAHPGPGEGRLFGGLVAAQSVLTALATIERGPDPDGRPASQLHSIHAYFLRPGRYDVPIRFVVHRIRDGRTFTTRRVVAHQGGEAIFNMAASFARPEAGMSHQRGMPEVAPPDGLEEWETLRARSLGQAEPPPFQSPIEVRPLDPSEFSEARSREPERMVWMRPRGTMPDDPDLQTAILVYATDRTLLSTAFRASGHIPGHRVMGASLDHAVWLHHPIRFDDWILYASVSPISQAARALVFGSIYTRDGVQLASVAQEALIREARSAKQQAEGARIPR